MRHHESNEQMALITWCSYIPELREYLFAIPNGGKRNVREAARLKREGVRAGVHDLFLPIPRGNLHGLWIEFKAARPNDAEYQKSQKEWEMKMLAKGYAAYCCRGLIEAKRVFTWYLSLPEVDSVIIPTLDEIFLGD